MCHVPRAATHKALVSKLVPRSFPVSLPFSGAWALKRHTTAFVFVSSFVFFRCVVTHFRRSCPVIPAIHSTAETPPQHPMLSHHLRCCSFHRRMMTSLSAYCSLFLLLAGLGGLLGIASTGGIGCQRAVQARATGTRRRRLLCRVCGIEKMKTS